MKTRLGDVKGSNLRTTLFSRRQFFRRLGIGLGGASIGGIALVSACKSVAEQPANSSTTQTTNSSVTTKASTKPVESLTPLTSPSKSTTVETEQPTHYTYVPPHEEPELIHVPDSTCMIATDRLYSIEHIWVKSISEDMVVLGITTSFVAILYEPYRLTLPYVGDVFSKYDSFGEIEGYKTIADLVCPVSGKIADVNEYLREQGGQGQGGYIASINGDPYVGGWMVVLNLSNSEELKDLLTPEAYLQRLGK